VPGVSGEVDLNAYSGSVTNWQIWVSQRSQ